MISEPISHFHPSGLSGTSVQLIRSCQTVADGMGINQPAADLLGDDWSISTQDLQCDGNAVKDVGEMAEGWGTRAEAAVGSNSIASFWGGLMAVRVQQGSVSWSMDTVRE